MQRFFTKIQIKFHLKCSEMDSWIMMHIHNELASMGWVDNLRTFDILNSDLIND